MIREVILNNFLNWRRNLYFLFTLIEIRESENQMAFWCEWRIKYSTQFQNSFLSGNSSHEYYLRDFFLLFREWNDIRTLCACEPIEWNVIMNSIKIALKGNFKNFQCEFRIFASPMNGKRLNLIQKKRYVSPFCFHFKWWHHVLSTLCVFSRMDLLKRASSGSLTFIIFEVSAEIQCDRQRTRLNHQMKALNIRGFMNMSQYFE